LVITGHPGYTESDHSLLVVCQVFVPPCEDHRHQMGVFLPLQRGVDWRHSPGVTRRCHINTTPGGGAMSSWLRSDVPKGYFNKNIPQRRVRNQETDIAVSRNVIITCLPPDSALPEQWSGRGPARDCDPRGRRHPPPNSPRTATATGPGLPGLMGQRRAIGCPHAAVTAT
jgi:hypothetical protein